ncbi:MAG TPA: MarR family winged helix-turn-helix transcriptional regulator [Skermanella sp.]|jgi:DNA-binding MarR family transcriptional regulator|nr:MarR family winged helix-turn-helix transcriptional regulator [Skermanella sp.]
MPHKLQALDLWRNVLVSSVKQAGPDLSSRQLALLLTVYLTPPPHTVRGLAGTLSISKPAISRALDRLGRLGFVRRKRDDADRRNVLVQRTVKGSVFLTEFSQLVLTSQQAAMMEATVEAGAGPADIPPQPLPEDVSNELVLAGPPD